MAAERVYTVEDYYDGPVSGVADFAGRPHFYQRLFDEAEEEYGSEFDLTPISPTLLALVLEKWAIWRRWELRFARKEVPSDSHPGYGGKDPEYDRFQKSIDELKAAVAISPIRVSGEFRPLASRKPGPVGVLCEMEVEWTAFSGK